MPSLGMKKKENQSRTDSSTGRLPQLSNEMQLSIMNKVKNGKISIEDALDEARKEQEQLLKEQPPSQYNFSVHKHGRYRWQKRVLQIDFGTKMLCSIEKGIIKRQLSFSVVKSCDDGVGSRFSISFKGHHDYELEATSMEDKYKMMQLVNQIIYGNIYSGPEDDIAETHEKPQAPQSLCEGVLLLHRGGLASLKWVKYEVQLHPGQLTLVPFRQRRSSDSDGASSDPVSIVIHLSDGDTSVQKPHGLDTFTLITHKNEYHFKVPEGPGTVQKERDAWVQAIARLCSEWKRKSMCESIFSARKSLQPINIPEEREDNNRDVESSGEFGGSVFYHLADSKNEDPSSNGGEASLGGETAQNDPSADSKLVPEPYTSQTPVQSSGSDQIKPLPSPTSPCAEIPASPSSPPPSPCLPGLNPEPQESGSPAMTVPPPPSIPAAPPLPINIKRSFKKPRTKVFHWDLVGSEKIAKTFWNQEKPCRAEIDSSRLHEQFAIKDLGPFSAAEQSHSQHIMLNQKIAHNFRTER